MRSDRITRNVVDQWADSTLDISNVSASSNANLYIKMKVYLNRERASSGSVNLPGPGGNTHIGNWPGAEWSAFRDSFSSTIEDAWNDRLWLIPDLPWGADFPNSASPTHLLNVRCCLKLEVVQSPADAHLRVRCVYVLDRSFRSSMIIPHFITDIARALGMVEFDGILCQHDLTPQHNSRSPDGVDQTTAVHEIGHALGLDHVNGPGNTFWHYGEGDHQQGDAMGHGSRIEEWHAYPWKRRIYHHLGMLESARVSWQAVAERRPPRLLTAAERISFSRPATLGVPRTAMLPFP